MTTDEKILTELAELRATELPPCPDWCTLPRDHHADPTAAAYDPEGRIHRSPAFGWIRVYMDDLAGYGFNVDGHEPVGYEASPRNGSSSTYGNSRLKQPLRLCGSRM